MPSLIFNSVFLSLSDTGLKFLKVLLFLTKRNSTTLYVVFMSERKLYRQAIGMNWVSEINVPGCEIVDFSCASLIAFALWLQSKSHLNYACSFNRFSLWMVSFLTSGYLSYLFFFFFFQDVWKSTGNKSKAQIQAGNKQTGARDDSGPAAESTGSPKKGSHQSIN